MAGRIFKKVSCPFCSWSKRSLMLPAHLMEHHSAEVRLRPVSKDHCILAYVMDKKEYLDFGYCFTCKKGFVGDGNDRNHERWITIHGKNTECISAHRQHLSCFKAAIAPPVCESNPVPNVTPPPSHTDVITTIWEQCKAHNLCRSSIEEVETQYMDDVFEPAIGIRQLALNVASYKKSVKKVEKQMTTMSQEHDRELTEQRVVLSQQQQDIQRLHSSVRQLNFENAEMIREIQDLKQKIALLEKGGVVPK